MCCIKKVTCLKIGVWGLVLTLVAAPTWLINIDRFEEPLFIVSLAIAEAFGALFLLIAILQHDSTSVKPKDSLVRQVGRKEGSISPSMFWVGLFLVIGISLTAGIAVASLDQLSEGECVSQHIKWASKIFELFAGSVLLGTIGGVLYKAATTSKREQVQFMLSFDRELTKEDFEPSQIEWLEHHLSKMSKGKARTILAEASLDRAFSRELKDKFVYPTAKAHKP